MISYCEYKDLGRFKMGFKNCKSELHFIRILTSKTRYKVSLLIRSGISIWRDSSRTGKSPAVVGYIRVLFCEAVRRWHRIYDESHPPCIMTYLAGYLLCYISIYRHIFWQSVFYHPRLQNHEVLLYTFYE